MCNKSRKCHGTLSGVKMIGQGFPLFLLYIYLGRLVQYPWSYTILIDARISGSEFRVVRVFQSEDFFYIVCSLVAVTVIRRFLRLWEILDIVLVLGASSISKFMRMIETTQYLLLLLNSVWVIIWRVWRCLLYELTAFIAISRIKRVAHVMGDWL